MIKRVQSDHPKVSVCVMTYNQERFIGECLESIVAQQTDFPFEIIVADDASTDGTAEVIRRFASKHGDLIRLIQHANNIGATANYLSAHAAARGDYVAHMDGDDVMLPGKLQKQAAALDADPALAFVATNALAFTTREDGSHAHQGRTGAHAYPPLLTFDEFLEHNGFFFVHSSKMYRRAKSPDLSGYDRLIDVQVHVLQAANGGVAYLDQPLLKYRLDAGVSVGRDGMQDHIVSIEMAERLGAAPRTIKYAYARACYEGALTSLRRRDYAEFRRRIELSVRYDVLRRPKDVAWRAALYRLRHTPGALAAVLRLKERAWRLRRRRLSPASPS